MPRIPLILSQLLITGVLASPAAADPPTYDPVTGTWPMDAPVGVERAFVPPPQPWRAGHRGVDIISSGTTVVSPIDGVVELARVVVDRGVVVVRSGDRQVSLEPVTATVVPGQRLAAGDPVGTLAGGPSHCAPRACLHWGLRVAGEYRDPLLLVQRYRAVLLP